MSFIITKKVRVPAGSQKRTTDIVKTPHLIRMRGFFVYPPFHLIHFHFIYHRHGGGSGGGRNNM